jgi:hypothetical protein
MIKRKSESPFERAVKDAPRDHVSDVKQRLESAYAKSGTVNPNLKKAIATLDTEPGWFLNLNGIYRDIILDRLRELASVQSNTLEPPDA